MKLGESDVLEMFRVRSAGEADVGQLAARFGISVSHAHAILRGEALAGVAPDAPIRLMCVRAERARWTAERTRLALLRRLPLASAVRDYRQGHSLRAAASRSGVHPSQLRRELVRQGVPLRPVGRPARHNLRSTHPREG